MFLGFPVPPLLFDERWLNALCYENPQTSALQNTAKQRGRRFRRPFVKDISLKCDRVPLSDQHVALPQRAMPIFSFRPSTPMAPTTICLPIT